MPGPEAERIFGRSNGKDLYSVIRGGGEYRVVTPEGEVVGKLDARFVNSSGSSEISLGGRTWSMVKCDEGHNLVVVVPSGSASSRIFWTGSDSAGFSSLVCQRVQQICSKGASSLPLGRREHELVDRALARLPEGIGPGGLYLSEDALKKGDVLIVSLQGIGFNQILALLLRHLLGNKVCGTAQRFPPESDPCGKGFGRFTRGCCSPEDYGDESGRDRDHSAPAPEGKLEICAGIAGSFVPGDGYLRSLSC